LVGGGEAGGLGQLEEGTERLEARIEVQRRGGARRQHRIEHLGGHGGLARQGRCARVVQVVGAQAPHEEVVDVAGGRVWRGGLGRVGGRGGWRGGGVAAVGVG